MTSTQQNAPGASTTAAAEVQGDLDPAEVVHVLEGWRKPSWATSVEFDEGIVRFARPGSGKVRAYESDFGIAAESLPELSRSDTIKLEVGDAPSISIAQGKTAIYLDIQELPIGEAPKLAELLLELHAAYSAGETTS